MIYEICESIDNLLKSKDSINIAIEGKSGVGKSTLASLLGEKYDCNIFHMDDFFLKPELKTKSRLDEPGGNVDYERFFTEIILGLRSGKAFRYQKYCCKISALTGFVEVKPKELNIIEGVYSLHPLFIDDYDLKIFLDIDDETQIERIRKRSGEVMLQKFVDLWIPLENRYFDLLNIREKCDLIFKT